MCNSWRLDWLATLLVINNNFFVHFICFIVLKGGGAYKYVDLLTTKLGCRYVNLILC